MPLDAICLSAVASELRGSICGARIDKIVQPERDEIIFSLRRDGNHRLLISAGQTNPRVHLTNERKENPDAAPMFCMLLRKHLSGARIMAITQPPRERVLIFEFDAVDDIGVHSQKQLSAELIGRHSNLILIDSEGRILDCLRHVDSEMSELRQVLPGLFYRLPPTQEKRDPISLSADELIPLTRDSQSEVSDWLMNNFTGLSPLVCRELQHLSGGSGRLNDAETRKRFIEAFMRYIDMVKTESFVPYLIEREGKTGDFSYFPILQYGGAGTLKRAESFSALLDEFYVNTERQRRVRERGQDLIKTVTNLISRQKRKLAVQREELKATEGRERLRELGDILMANLNNITKGIPFIRAQDYYDAELRKIEIKLDPQLSPRQNAAKYYKDYSKAKNAEIFLTEQIRKGEIDLEYFESVLEEISRASGESDLREIRQELEESGIVKRSRKKEKSRPAQPLAYVSSSGFPIYVGKNNRQNDELTLKTAAKRDVWLHAQKIHGAHVIIVCSGAEPDDQTLTEGACLAAYYSKGRGGQNVPVDYTVVSNVKKPSGSKPGMVIYDKYKTLYVTPDKQKAEMMTRKIK